MASTPVKALFEENILSWQSVYYHYLKWCTTGVLKKTWTSSFSYHF